MDNAALTRPRVDDPEALGDFFDALSDYAPRIERDVANLLKQPGDWNLTASLFRSMHTVKGDASLCKLPGIVAIAHPVETLLARHREGEIGFTHTLAELVLLTLDRIELAVEAMRQGRTLEHLGLVALVEGLERLSTVPADMLEKATREVIGSVTGLTPSGRPSGRIGEHPATAVRADTDSDLALFKRLALQLEARSPLYRGRTLRNLRLALQTNKEAGTPVDPRQMEAAVYMHDIGMMFLKESVWLKAELLTPDDRQALRTHPGMAADLMERMPGWSEAALMVRQHHETPCGKGYRMGSGKRIFVPAPSSSPPWMPSSRSCSSTCTGAAAVPCCAPSPRSTPAATSFPRNGLNPSTPWFGASSKHERWRENRSTTVLKIKNRADRAPRTAPAWHRPGRSRPRT